MLFFSWLVTIFDLNCGDSTLAFYLYRIDLESDRGFLEEGSRKLTFWIYLISRTVFNIFMKTSYNIAVLLQISAFYFPTFKRQIALYSPCRLVGRSVGWLVGRLVGRSVGWSVDVTINSFNIYRHKSPLLTQYHSIPISTNQYQVILTQYHLVTTSITPY